MDQEPLLEEIHTRDGSAVEDDQAALLKSDEPRRRVVVDSEAWEWLVQDYLVLQPF